MSRAEAPGDAERAAGLRLVTHPLAQDRLAQLRAAATPRDAFRRALADLGALLAAEALADAPALAGRVATPRGVADAVRVDETRVLLVAVLRAGLGFLAGAQRCLPAAPVGLVGLRRERGGTALAQYLVRLPPDPGGPVLVLDPMLATGASAVRAVDLLGQHGVDEARIRFLAAVVAPEGLRRLREAHPRVTLFAAALDQGLDAQLDIVPGIGDAGDRLFGTEGG